ncbi:5'-methylthioadenosine/S-adenosylhomocysteine nucleosidase family protein [Mycoplasma sp. 1573]
MANATVIKKLEKIKKFVDEYDTKIQKVLNKTHTIVKDPEAAFDKASVAADILFVIADYDDFDPYNQYFNFIQETEMDMYDDYTIYKYESKLSGHRFDVLFSGVGKVNASLASTIARLYPNTYSVVYNIGSACSIRKDVPVLSTHAISNARYWDVDATAIKDDSGSSKYTLGQIPGEPISYNILRNEEHSVMTDYLGIDHVSWILTGDSFVTKDNPILSNPEFKKYQLVDMEATGFIHGLMKVFESIGVTGIFKVVSDNIYDDNNPKDYEKNRELVCQKICKLMDTLVYEISIYEQTYQKLISSKHKQLSSIKSNCSYLEALYVEAKLMNTDNMDLVFSKQRDRELMSFIDNQDEIMELAKHAKFGFSKNHWDDDNEDYDDFDDDDDWEN